MTRIADRLSNIMGPLVIIFAFVAIMVPTCQMVGCNGMMSMPHFGMGTTFSADCPGTVVISSTPVGITPTGADSLLFSLVAALVAVAVALAPRVSARPVRIVDSTPPPPPEDPLGERFRV